MTSSGWIAERVKSARLAICGCERPGGIRSVDCGARLTTVVVSGAHETRVKAPRELADLLGIAVIRAGPFGLGEKLALLPSSSPARPDAPRPRL
jgi:hypothetical protein